MRSSHERRQTHIASSGTFLRGHEGTGWGPLDQRGEHTSRFRLSGATALPTGTAFDALLSVRPTEHALPPSHGSMMCRLVVGGAKIALVGIDHSLIRASQHVRE